MRKIISRIMVVTDDEAEQKVVANALARTGAQLVFAPSERAAQEILTAKPNELPGLIIVQAKHLGEDDPLILYTHLRSEPATQGIPLLVLVKTSLEHLVVQRLELVRCVGVLAPLNFGKLVYALPALGLEINESTLYDRPVASWQKASLC